MNFFPVFNGAEMGGVAPLFRYWRSAGRNSDHLYTTNAYEIGTVVPGLVGRHGYRSEGVACLIYTYKVSDSIPLYRYFGPNNDHFYTTNAKEIGTTTPGQKGKHNYVSEGAVGYCFPSQRCGTVPLYRYWNPSLGDHLYTNNVDEIGTAAPGQKGKHGYISEGVVCNVLASFQ